MIALALALLAAPASPPRPGLSDLVYALGEAHALRQVCRGRSDGYWYTRMQGLLAAEKPDKERRLQLIARFNGGYAAGKGAHPACDEAARSALTEAAERAAPLARALARPD